MFSWWSPSRLKRIYYERKIFALSGSKCFISSPEQRSRRAIVLPSASASASASTNVKVFVKVFKTSLFPNLIIDFIHLWYDDTYWSKILRSTIPNITRSCHGQGHRLRIFMLKFYVKVFRISLLLNYMMDLFPIWYHARYWSKDFISTTSTHDRHLEVKITDLEIKC